MVHLPPYNFVRVVSGNELLFDSPA